MTTQERIDELESEIFYLQMQDRWTCKDHERMNRLQNELNRLKTPTPQTPPKAVPIEEEPWYQEIMRQGEADHRRWWG